MLMQQEGNFNRLSPELRKELEEKITGFGKTVRYRFDISNPNPDPTFHNGKILYPHLYTLDPSVFNINDPHEKRQGEQRSKRIGLVIGLDEKTNVPNKFEKIRIYDRQKGVLVLSLDNTDDVERAIFLELHPKLSNGKFSDSTKRQIITRVDEQSAAREAREARSAKTKARKAAEELSDKGVIDFADAMMWDSAQDLIVLRNQIEELAETNPEFFNDLVGGKSVEYQAAVKQALNKKIIAFDPAENKFTYTSNKQTIAMLQAGGEKNEVQKMADWLEHGGGNATQVYNKLKSLIEGKEEVVA